MTPNGLPPRPPIVIDEHGDVDVFTSVEAAVRSIEPIDVRNHEYVAYDSAGFVLELVPSEPVVGIPGRVSGPPQAERLAQALREYMQRASGTGSPAVNGSLEALLAAFVDRYGVTT